MDLRIDGDALNACVQCGLCLPHCPTYRVTSDEAMSPRGRIALMREVQLNDAPLTSEVVRSFDSCIQCRGCEPACPSGVQYGRLIESTRHTLAGTRRGSTWFRRALFAPLDKPRLLRAGSWLLGVAARMRLVPSRLAVPADLPLRRAAHTTSGDDVLLFTGCVMDAWQRDVHHATQRNLEAAGFGVTPTGDAAPCCGALHAHAGLDERALAERTIEALPGDAPIVVNSAGCGAAMKEYGVLLGTSEAAAFAARVVDAQEFLAMHLAQLPAAEVLDLRVAVQDPCHVRHVQRVHPATRAVLAPYVRELIELDDDGLCCGAGGAYAAFEPGLAGEVRDRKVASIDRAAPDIVASANPGCSMHLAAGGVDTIHPMQLVDRALSGH